ncbi:transcription antitermination factor NusB [Gloeobacter kilaueensis]|uniref:Transcription antitermination protein NusB n=1 Tax=Gloeobacter kilaueensis (strain ATCC BAA-2537 / CCAP 1431/1 / ULC 316 / JS1) TaxID=1183438 RepID=U5QSC9_GLOK1|nr:transcription antitermination factor NusB [Gloeobacter kilaueensis]AGY60630.1 transcription antitermination protein NusB [Gloeobacter kilaueensis JS1]
MQARRIARELVLMNIGHLSADRSKKPPGTRDLQELVLTAVRTLQEEANESLKHACAELRTAHQHLLTSELTARNLDQARSEANSAIELTEQAINRVGAALEVPEFVRLADDLQVRSYALELLGAYAREAETIDGLLDSCMEGWQLDRLSRIDRDILRLALTEMATLKSVPYRVAIDEAIELAKKYSSETAGRFVNGVLRRVVQHLKLEQAPRA